jgi:hypothetical protein
MPMSVQEVIGEVSVCAIGFFIGCPDCYSWCSANECAKLAS